MLWRCALWYCALVPLHAQTPCLPASLLLLRAGGPGQFGGPSPYTPPPSPPSPPPASPGASPKPDGPIDPSISSATTLLDVYLTLVGANLSPLTIVTQQAIEAALTVVWTPADGIQEVRFKDYRAVANSSQAVLAEVWATPVPNGQPPTQAPAAASYIVTSVAKGLVLEALANEGELQRNGAQRQGWSLAARPLGGVGF